jgi:hypothetical protein
MRINLHRHCEEPGAAFGGARATRQSSLFLKLWIASLTLAMTLTVTACVSTGTYKSPSVSGNPSKMSADTLCYRAATARANAALKDEIRARNLDCAAILESDPLLDSSRY